VWASIGTPKEFEALFDSSDPEAYFEQRGKWAILYGPMSDMSFGDADLWEEHSLPVAGDQAYPVAVWFGPAERCADQTPVPSQKNLDLFFFIPCPLTDRSPQG
jgi:hypothetical protein